jgi:predicted permease
MRQVRDEVATLPGVGAVALTSGGPLFGGGDTDGIAIEGQPTLPPDQMPTVEWFDMDEHYFETLGVRIVNGRGLSASDTFGAPHVAVVNEALARRFFQGENPIGKRVTVESFPAEIVGVAADVKPLRPDASTRPQIYWSIQQYRRGAAYLVLRTTPGIPGIEQSIKARVAVINPAIQLNTFRTLDEQFARGLVSPRFNMLLVTSFALVAVLMAAVGVYGVNAYAVASRTREFGVRAALGASPSQLVTSVIRRGMALASVGIVAGFAGAIAIGRLLTSLLYGLPARDPVTLVGAVVILTVVAAIACWVPARRASRVDPVAALRAQ